MSVTSTVEAVYGCSQCGARLVDDSEDGWQDWRRCPSCGKPHRPPASVFTRAEASSSGSEMLYIGPDARMSAIHVRAIGSEKTKTSPLHIPRAETDWPVRRILLAGSLFACILFFVFALLGRESTRASVFGIGAIGSLLLLMQPRRRRRF